MGEQLHFPGNVSIAGHAGTLCCVCHAPAVVLLCRETAVMALEMLSWRSTLGNVSAHGNTLVISLPSTFLLQMNQLFCSSFPLAL